MTGELDDVAAQVWRLAGGPAEMAGVLTISGPRSVWPAFFDVTGLAAGSVAVAALAATEFLAARNQTRPRPVSVDSRAACAAFAAGRLFTPVGWSRPELWDPLAGDYRAGDGWIRLHTNYRSHRAAVERLLGVRGRDSVQAAASAWKAADLEAAVVAAGGCAAAMRTREAWLAAAPGGAAAGAAPLTAGERRLPAGTARALPASGQPFAGVRVLDLTRVIAGPVCTKFLAAYGAAVLRIDPPGFAEVPGLLPEVTAGKRTAALDLSTAAGRGMFEHLLAGADVLVSGLRADALARLGYSDEALTALSPALILASLNAYGWDGPWRDRRGFDSLVQMSCGIAAAGAAGAGRDRPVPLPVQALDHATGYLLAAAVGRALTRRLTQSTASRIRASLIGTANVLWSLPTPSDLPATPKPGGFPLTGTLTAWGPARRVPPSAMIAGVNACRPIPAGPLGRLDQRLTSRAGPAFRSSRHSARPGGFPGQRSAAPEPAISRRTPGKNLPAQEADRRFVRGSFGQVRGLSDRAAAGSALNWIVGGGHGKLFPARFGAALFGPSFARAASRVTALATSARTSE